MKKISLALVFIVAIIALSTVGCSADNRMQDGYYTAMAGEYSHGWKEFVSITVKNGDIASVEYNAVNESGFIKSWDNAYMQNMKAVQGTYPNEYTRNYAGQLLEAQNANQVDTIAGATSSYSSFKMLASAAIEQAKKGDSRVVVVDSEK